MGRRLDQSVHLLDQSSRKSPVDTDRFERQAESNARVPATQKRRSRSRNGIGIRVAVEPHYRRQRSGQKLLTRCRVVGADAQVAPRSQFQTHVRICRSSIGSKKNCVDRVRRRFQVEVGPIPQHLRATRRSLGGKGRTALEPRPRDLRPCRRRIFRLGSGPQLLENEGEYRRSRSVAGICIVSERSVGRFENRIGGSRNICLQWPIGRLGELDPRRWSGRTNHECDVEVFVSFANTERSVAARRVGSNVDRRYAKDPLPPYRLC